MSQSSLTDKVVQTLPDGTLTVTENRPDGYRTVRYFDSRRQMIMNIVDKSLDRTVLTKYNPDGHTVHSVMVETKTGVTVYQKDGKTIIRERETLPDGSETENIYQEDGVTLKRTSLYHVNGAIFTTLYQKDGKTPTQLIEQDVKGLSRISFYAPDGQTVIKTVADLSDGSTQTTLFQPGSHKIACVDTGPLKGAAHPNTYRRDTYDESGSKIISSEEIVR